MDPIRHKETIITAIDKWLSANLEQNYLFAPRPPRTLIDHDCRGIQTIVRELCIGENRDILTLSSHGIILKDARRIETHRQEFVGIRSTNDLQTFINKLATLTESQSVPVSFPTNGHVSNGNEATPKIFRNFALK